MTSEQMLCLKIKKISIWHTPVLVVIIPHEIWGLLLHKNLTSSILKIFIIIKENTLYYSRRSEDTCFEVLLAEVDLHGFAQAHK